MKGLSPNHWSAREFPVSACFYLSLCLDRPCWSPTLLCFVTFPCISVSVCLLCLYITISLYLSPLCLSVSGSPLLLSRLTEKYLEAGSPVELNVQFPSLGVPSAPLCYSWEPDLLVTWESSPQAPHTPAWVAVGGWRGWE